MAKPATDLEALACVPTPVRSDWFNPRAVIPYGVTTANIEAAMIEFTNFLGFVNQPLHERGIDRLETMMMPAGFSSMVGEFMAAGIPKYCSTIVKNAHHNGHPDLIPPGVYPNNDVLHGIEGIELKGSRYLAGWQGHNAEPIWLMVFVFASSRPSDLAKGIAPQPFRFLEVVGAQLSAKDWNLQGRGEGSRRTITASVLKSGHEKMTSNWIYRDPALVKIPAALTLELAEEE